MLDLRLTGLWAELFEVPREQWDPELIGWYLRTAYSQGYADAMSYIDRAEMRDELERIDQAYPDAARRARLGSDDPSLCADCPPCWRRYVARVRLNRPRLR